MEDVPIPAEITKHNAALALVDGRGLERFGGPALAAALVAAAREKATKQVLGDGPRWHAAIAALEELTRRKDGAVLQPTDVLARPSWQGDVAAPRVGRGAGEAGAAFPAAQATQECADRARVKALLMDLCPWRKGPFEVLGVDLDAEWRCDQKWARVMNATSVAGKTVLDVGCGNGYYLLRALGAGASAALGIDPTWLYVAQFNALRRVSNPTGGSAPSMPAWVLPLALEDIRAPHVPTADVVLSMGVLYHRKSPLEHLDALREVVRPGGTLVLETLVVEGDDRTVLVPKDRYAAMRNVWMIPSIDAARGWLRRCGYRDVAVADVTVTTSDEQRATEFMASASLRDFLDPSDPRQTIEGYPAPCRAVFLARRG